MAPENEQYQNNHENRERGDQCSVQRPVNRSIHCWDHLASLIVPEVFPYPVKHNHCVIGRIACHCQQRSYNSLVNICEGQYVLEQ